MHTQPSYRPILCVRALGAMRRDKHLMQINGSKAANPLLTLLKSTTIFPQALAS